MVVLLLPLLLLLSLPHQGTTGTWRLHAAIVVTRHGDRSALEPLPPSVVPHINAERQQQWLGEPRGRLTLRGEEQQRRLGARLRCRYGALVGGGFNRRRVWVRSTPLDRTLRSAQAFLAGLFSEEDECGDGAAPAGEAGAEGTSAFDFYHHFGQPAQTPEQATETTLGSGTGCGEVADRSEPAMVPLHTIPIHSLPRNQDTLLMAFDNCPRFTTAVATMARAGPEWDTRDTLERQAGGVLDVWSQLLRQPSHSAEQASQPWSLSIPQFVRSFDSLNVVLVHGGGGRNSDSAGNGATAAVIAPELTSRPELLSAAGKLYHWAQARKYSSPMLGRLGASNLVRAIRMRLQAVAKAVAAGNSSDHTDSGWGTVEEAGLSWEDDGHNSNYLKRHSSKDSFGAPLTPFTLCVHLLISESNTLSTVCHARACELTRPTRCHLICCRYSAHDSTLLALLSALGTPLAYNPPYASSFALELWHHPDLRCDGLACEESEAGGDGSDENELDGWFVGATFNGGASRTVC